MLLVVACPCHITTLSYRLVPPAQQTLLNDTKGTVVLICLHCLHPHQH